MQETPIPSVPPAGAPEEVVWEGTPSHWTGWRSHTLSAFIVASAIAAAYFIPDYRLEWVLATVALGLIPGFWRAITVASTRYQLTSQRLITARGVLTREVHELELYRVKDMVLFQPIMLRLVGMGHVVLKTSDFSSPTLVLYSIARPRQVQELIRQYVEAARIAKGVREVDIERSV